jgi:hypothetical protein
MMDLDRLKDEQPVYAIAAKWVRLRRRSSGKWTHGGPCPFCSDKPESKTATRFECNALAWTCAVCADGGDVIKLVMLHESLDFRGAIDWLGGAQQTDPAEEEKRRAAREERRRKHDEEGRFYREKKRRELYTMWCTALELPGTPAQEYLRLRGFSRLAPAFRLRCILNMPYYLVEDDAAQIIHRGPAMVAAILRPDGVFGGLHFTYIDLSRPKGKIELRHPETGELLEAKIARGSKQGGHAVLTSPPEPTQMILGEGIEKTGAVWLALDTVGRDLSRTAFWVALDLGNLAGRSSASVPHPTRRTKQDRVQRVPGPTPDFTAPAIAIPDSITDLVLLGDSTSDAFDTQCAMARGAVRYARKGRRVRCAWAPPGVDFDDMIRGVAA